jgi:uncharacterized membrane protein YgcG
MPGAIVPWLDHKTAAHVREKEQPTMGRRKTNLPFEWALATLALVTLIGRQRRGPAAQSPRASGNPDAGRNKADAAPAPTSSSGERSASAPRRPARRGRQIGTALSFAALFVAGGALSAAAGELLAEPSVVAADCTTTAADSDVSSPECADTTPETSTNGETVPTSGSEEPVSPPTPDSSTEEPGGSDTTPVSGDDGSVQDGGSTDGEGAGTGGGDAGASGSGGSSGGGSSGSAGGGRSAPPVVDADRPAPVPTALDPEATASEFGATVWLHRTLPDPTPSAKRLAPSFARALREVSAQHGVNWALLLGVVRAQGSSGRVPATEERLVAVAQRLASLRASLGTRRDWPVVLAFSGRTSFADRAVALSRYNRALGLKALVIGLTSAKPMLIKRVLADERIQIYPGGRDDVRAGRIDVRVLVLIRYLRIAHGSVTVSSLVSGHRLFARPGVVSAHVYGFAVDISALGGVSILGNQDPGGPTERAIRNILLLPAEVRPLQVISLLGLGGASFPLADHYDHLHIGF